MARSIPRFVLISALVCITNCREVGKTTPEVLSVDPERIALDRESPTSATIDGRRFYTEIHHKIDSRDPPSLDKRFDVYIDESRLFAIQTIICAQL